MIGVRWGKRRVTTNKQDVDNKGKKGHYIKRKTNLLIIVIIITPLVFFASVSFFHI